MKQWWRLQSVRVRLTLWYTGALAHRALAPVGRMADQARTITAERLGERLPVVNPDDELGYLATVFSGCPVRRQRDLLR